MSLSAGTNFVRRWCPRLAGASSSLSLWRRWQVLVLLQCLAITLTSPIDSPIAIPFSRDWPFRSLHWPCNQPSLNISNPSVSAPQSTITFCHNSVSPLSTAQRAPASSQINGLSLIPRQFHCLKIALTPLNPLSSLSFSATITNSDPLPVNPPLLVFLVLEQSDLAVHYLQSVRISFPPSSFQDQQPHS